MTQRYQINVQNIMYKRSFKRGRKSARSGKRSFGAKKGGRRKSLTRYTLSRGGIRL